MRKNKIRILHVAQAAGGVDRYIRMLLKYLDKEKFENILVCSQDFHEEDYKGLLDSFEQIEMTRAIGRTDLKAIKEVRALIKKYNPDIIYAHSSKAGAIARVADIGIKNRCVYNPHGWAFNMRCSAKKKAMYTAIEKIAAPFCDKIICIAFSAFYLAVIKPLSNMNFDSVYDMLRVDFGRDDVIKYVIYEEFFEKNHILDYPGQSFFSTLFIFIPRIIWPNKPYSHYQYLTSSILGLPISKLPAGTTPCWYEMTLCNFGYFGYLVGIFGLIGFCYFADGMKQTKSKSLVFMLILVLLTQNTDVYIVYILFIFMYYLEQHIKHPKIVLRIGR